jgi:hypothetical protein
MRLFTTLLAGISLVSGALAEMAAGCGKALTLTEDVQTMTVRSQTRQYYVKIPKCYIPPSPTR